MNENAQDKAWHVTQNCMSAGDNSELNLKLSVMLPKVAIEKYLLCALANVHNSSAHRCCS